MVRKIKGHFSARGKKFGIVVSEFNEYLTGRLLEGTLETLRGHGAREKDLSVVWVPGAFELPLAAKKLLKAGKWDALIALAVVIKGETKHFDQVVMEAARGIRELSMKSEVPVILGMVSARSAEQAVARVGLKQMNKGREWALSAIQMANVMRRLSKRSLAHA
ncbi:MAG: 6,7-dimethyl-8-ribityllumazine synthase [Candidatus Omnitrophica bacterium]|nr:6,7-dimethyl-8-ribityllumazine synthase [Candidatus Omnitrophota bacterium]